MGAQMLASLRMKGKTPQGKESNHISISEGEDTTGENELLIGLS